jgi:hypothetical protein
MSSSSRPPGWARCLLIAFLLAKLATAVAAQTGTVTPAGSAKGSKGAAKHAHAQP